MKLACRHCGECIVLDRNDQPLPCVCAVPKSQGRAQRRKDRDYVPCDSWDLGDDPDWQYGDRLQFGFEFFANGEDE